MPDTTQTWSRSQQGSLAEGPGDWVTLAVAARTIGVSLSAIRRASRAGRIGRRLVQGPHGPQWEVRSSEVADVLAGGRASTVPARPQLERSDGSAPDAPGFDPAGSSVGIQGSGQLTDVPHQQESDPVGPSRLYEAFRRPAELPDPVVLPPDWDELLADVAECRQVLDDVASSLDPHSFADPEAGADVITRAATAAPGSDVDELLSMLSDLDDPMVEDELVAAPLDPQPAPDRPAPDQPDIERRPDRLHGFFEASCDRTPDAIALECEGSYHSYRSLDEQANRLAHHLMHLGIRQDTRVGILLQRSVDTYVALLAAQKAAATFVPIDPGSPADRVNYIASDAGLDLLISTTVFDPVTEGLRCPIVRLDTLIATLEALSTQRPPALSSGDPTCYIIYTSGSSGRPKGVEVAQSSICNFIDVVPAIYGVRFGDRVYQGMTIAFDFSIEEIWPTWAVGATIVAGPTDSRRLGSELAEFLADAAVTMLYCVPTVLATIDRELPLIHTLLVGGEACPGELVTRWSRPGRRILNTYGPTEATVTCTWAELLPGKTVTIGRPLPTYNVHILDASCQPVPDGEIGEICVGGPGVARGYVGRPDLTAERFIPHPVGDGRLYRTGDLGRVLADGEIEYLGRADSEVKVRGHRVDLQEIENVLLEDVDVSSAAVRLVSSNGSGGELAGYITFKSAQADEDAVVARLHGQLRQRLPLYMVPATVDVLDALPLMPSGKVDRGKLPDPIRGRLISGDGEHAAASTALEEEMAATWAAVFGLETDQLSVEADFFLDLGGHSLLAATTVSMLRRQAGAEAIAIRDLYEHPTVRQLAAHLEATRGQAAPEAAQRTERRTPSRLRVALCGLAQSTLLYVLVLVFGLPVAIVYLINDGEITGTTLAHLAMALPVSYLVGRWLLPVIGSRVLAVRLAPGRYPLWGVTYVRVWLLQRLLAVSPVGSLSGSPLLSPYLRLLGARVGRGAHVATGTISIPKLIEIGDGANVGYSATLQPFAVEDGWVVIDRVTVGQRAFVGASAIMLPGAALEDNARLGEHSMLAAGQRVPAGERWIGSPSRRSTETDVLLERMEQLPAAPQRWSPGLLVGFLAGWLGLELLPFVFLAPAVALVWWALLTSGVQAGLVTTLFAGLLYVVTACTVISVCRELALPSTPTGIHPLRSKLGVRKWLADKLLEMSLDATNTLYSTLYTVPWLRALGARVGRRAEVSTVAHLDPDLLVLKGESFVADMASVGSAAYHEGYVAFEYTEVGRRSFVGNASFVRSGTSLGDESLVGAHTIPPDAGVPPGTSWLGSPAIHLPRRQESQSFDDVLTYTPSRLRVLERLVIEFLRVVLPATVLALATFGGLLGISALTTRLPSGGVIAATPLVMVAAGLGVVLVVAVLKWLLVWRYRPRVVPLWHRFVRRTELVTGLYEAAAVPALLAALTGTPLLGPVLRLYGARIGRRTWIDTTYLTEFDLVQVGDDAVVGTGSSLQTHLFEDRVMKMSVVRIEDRASVGSRSVVLYDAVVGQDAALDAMSLVMKGERLLAGTQWRGIPAQSVS